MTVITKKCPLPLYLALYMQSSLHDLLQRPCPPTIGFATTSTAI